MPATYEPIATTTLGSAASTIDFNSIGSGYTDLRLVLVCTTTVSDAVLARVNGDTANNYSRTLMWGDGTSASSTRYINNPFFEIGGASASTTIPMLITCDFFSYAGSTNKTLLMTSALDRNGAGDVYRSVQLWRSTSAITSISLIANGTTFKSGSTATLYGILKA